MTLMTPEQAVEVKACRLSDLAEGIGRELEVAGKSIAVFKTRSGGVHAVANRCPHKGGPLVDGIVVGEQIICPMHAARFGLRDGACDRAEVCAVDSFPVRVDSDWVFVRVTVSKTG